MYCTECNQFFHPTPEEERLIIAGAISQRCIECETKHWREQVAQEERKNQVVPGYRIRGDGTELYKIDWFDTLGRVSLYMALPVVPMNQRRAAALRGTRKDGLQVFVLSEAVHKLTSRRPSQPRYMIHNNLQRVLDKHDRTLWFQKVPDYADGPTGAGRIEVPAKDIAAVDAAVNTLRVGLVNKEYIRLMYR